MTTPGTTQGFTTYTFSGTPLQADPASIITTPFVSTTNMIAAVETDTELIDKTIHYLTRSLGLIVTNPKVSAAREAEIMEKVRSILLLLYTIKSSERTR